VPAGITSSWCSCTQLGQWVSGAYSYNNNIWGSGAGRQCIWATPTNKWGVAANHPATAGVKAFPNVTVTPQKAISAIASYTSSFDVTLPSSGSWDTTYTLALKSTNLAHAEIGIWMNSNGSVQPTGSAPDRTKVLVGGHVWNVYFSKYGSNDEIISFVRTQNTNSGTVDILAILLWIITNNDTSYGSIAASWTFDRLQFGFEITSDGSTQAFVTNSFSVTSS